MQPGRARNDGRGEEGQVSELSSRLQKHKIKSPSTTRAARTARDSCPTKLSVDGGAPMTQRPSPSGFPRSANDASGASYGKLFRLDESNSPTSFC